MAPSVNTLPDTSATSRSLATGGVDIEAPAHQTSGGSTSASFRSGGTHSASTMQAGARNQAGQSDRLCHAAKALGLMAVGSGLLTAGVFALENHKNATWEPGVDMADGFSIGRAVLLFGLGGMCALASIPSMLDSCRRQG